MLDGLRAMTAALVQFVRNLLFGADEPPFFQDQFILGISHIEVAAAREALIKIIFFDEVNEFLSQPTVTSLGPFEGYAAAKVKRELCNFLECL